MNKGLLPLIAALTFAACATDIPERRGSVVRDSAGIRIVESTSPRWSTTEAWSVDPAPLLDLATSGTGPPHEFYRVRDAIRLPDGVIAVADYTSGEIRFFSSTGEFLRAVGRRGEGPGEFQRLTSVHQFRSDSLIAFDYWARRVTVLSPQREVSRIITLRLPFVRKLHPLDQTSFVATFISPSVLRAEGVEGLVRKPEPVVRFSLTGKVIDTVAFSAGVEEVLLSSGAHSPLFGKLDHLAVYQERIYLGSADQMQIDVLGANGRLERIIRVPDYDLHLSAQELQAERDWRLGEDSSPFVRDYVSSLPDPETKPAYADLLVDTEGFAWAAKFQGRAESNEPQRWNVFDPAGEWLGSVQVPARFTVYEIGRDYVLGLWRDADDVEHVRMYELIKP